MREQSSILLTAASIMLLLVCASARAENKPVTVEIGDEVVCRVNTQTLSNRTVEDRMQGIADRLHAFRRMKEAKGEWTKADEDQYWALYKPAFKEALRTLVKERLMLQSAEAEKVTVDELDLRKEYERNLDTIKSKGLYNQKDFTAADIRRRTNEDMLIQRYQNIMWALEQPKWPEIQKYYTQNIDNYKRKAGVKVRMIRIDRFTIDPQTRQPKVRENAAQFAESLREECANGGNFEEIARRSSDDTESRKRGGLVVIDASDPYLDPNEYNAQLANAIGGLNTKEVSKVFELGPRGESSYAIAQVVDRREAGATPLEGKLYDEIYEKLYKQKRKKKEDDWFRKALSKSLVVHVFNGKEEPLSIDYFITPEESVAQKTNAK